LVKKNRAANRLGTLAASGKPASRVLNPARGIMWAGHDQIALAKPETVSR